MFLFIDYTNQTPSIKRYFWITSAAAFDAAKVASDPLDWGQTSQACSPEDPTQTWKTPGKEEWTSLNLKPPFSSSKTTI